MLPNKFGDRQSLLRKPGQPLAGKVEIRATHEIMAARTPQLALLVDKLAPALRTKPPVLAGNVIVRWRGTGVFTFVRGFDLFCGYF